MPLPPRPQPRSARDASRGGDTGDVVVGRGGDRGNGGDASRGGGRGNGGDASRGGGRGNGRGRGSVKGSGGRGRGGRGRGRGASVRPDRAPLTDARATAPIAAAAAPTAAAAAPEGSAAQPRAGASVQWGGAAALIEGDASSEAEVDADAAARADELLALEAIYSDEMCQVEGGGGRTFELRVPIELEAPLSLPSGERLDALPPLTLRVRHGSGYPSSSPPGFGLRCCWLSDGQLEALAASLDGLAAAAAGELCVSAWAEWLRTEAAGQLELLQEGATLSLPAEGGTGQAGADEATASAGERRAQRWPRSRAEVLARLRQHAAAADAAAWASAVHDCGVCFDEYASLDCTRLHACGHTFCKSCLRGYWSSQLREGHATALLCPHPGCGAVASPPEAKALLSAGEYETYERLLLAASLAEMTDTSWCPRCEYPAQLEPRVEGRAGRVAICGTREREQSVSSRSSCG